MTPLVIPGWRAPEYLRLNKEVDRDGAHSVDAE